MNKRITLAVVASLVALSVTGCASSPAPSNSAPAPAPVYSYDPPVYEPPAQSEEDIFYSVIEPRFPGVSRSTAVTLGKSVCSALDSGASILDVGQVAVNNGFSYSDAGYLVGAAIATFCPEYEDDARALIGN
jgi:serine/threonine-protein kinase